MQNTMIKSTASCENDTQKLLLLYFINHGNAINKTVVKMNGSIQKKGNIMKCNGNFDLCGIGCIGCSRFGDDCEGHPNFEYRNGEWLSSETNRNGTKGANK